MKNRINDSLLKTVDIEELGLSVLSYNSLKRAGVNSILDVLEIVEQDKLTNIRNIGEKAKQEIIQKLENLLSKLEDKKGNNSAASNKIELISDRSPEFKFSDNISIDCLENELGKGLINQLLSIGIQTVGDLESLVSQLLNALKNNGDLIKKATEILEEKVKVKIKNSGLQAGVAEKGKKLYSVLYQVPKSFEEKLQKYNALQRVLQSNSLKEDLVTIYDGIAIRDKIIFVKYTLNNVTYKDLGFKFNISRERIRQIFNQTVEKLCERLKDTSSLYLQSALLIADNMGEELTEEKLRKELIRQGMVSFRDQDIVPDTFELMLALIMNPDTSVLIEMKNLAYE